MIMIFGFFQEVSLTWKVSSLGSNPLKLGSSDPLGHWRLSVVSRVPARVSATAISGLVTKQWVAGLASLRPRIV